MALHTTYRNHRLVDSTKKTHKTHKTTPPISRAAVQHQIISIFCWNCHFSIRRSLYETNPNYYKGNPPKIYHTFALFDPLQKKKVPFNDPCFTSHPIPTSNHVAIAAIPRSQSHSPKGPRHLQIHGEKLREASTRLSYKSVNMRIFMCCNVVYVYTHRWFSSYSIYVYVYIYIYVYTWFDSTGNVKY